VRDIFDPNVKVLGRTSGSSPESGEGTIFVSNGAAIVVNENPAFSGGKVLGTGYNMLLGLGGDFSMFDNIMSFMLS
ncbi:MAG: hypothetical protein ACRD38_13415, partial [Nitrososphaerales archaeon]